MKGYEWDENKRASNITKHHLDFVDAIKVFDDMDRIEFESERHGEKRLQTIGMIENIIVVCVVYVHRTGKKRIVSARSASKKERNTYYASRFI